MKRAFIPKSFRPKVPGSMLKVIKKSSFRKDGKVRTLERIVILSSIDDLVAKRVCADSVTSASVLHLYFDDLGYTWDFIFRNGDLLFFKENAEITPLAIYHRHPGVFKEHHYYNKHLAFFEVMDIWTGNSIGQKRDHFQNSSKPFQAINSLVKFKNSSVTIPKTYLIKGNIEKISEKIKDNLITKSCSSMRSIAATAKDFKEWKIENLQNLPTLFQECVVGVDQRVHILDNQCWSLEVSSKDHIDYRYSSRGTIKYNLTELPASIYEFCKNLASVEKNRFVGIDFIKKNEKYFCLECNPGPGWSTFNHPSRSQFTHSFIKALKKKDSKL